MNVADSQWMALALRLAERGLYTTSPESTGRLRAGP